MPVHITALASSSSGGLYTRQWAKMWFAYSMVEAMWQDGSSLRKKRLSEKNTPYRPPVEGLLGKAWLADQALLRVDSFFLSQCAALPRVKDSTTLLLLSTEPGDSDLG